MSEGTVIDRLKNIQQELMQIAHQVAREGLMEWPLIPIMTTTEQALDKYIQERKNMCSRVGDSSL